MDRWTADFETTTDKNDCRVWAYALCNINAPDTFLYGTNIDDFMCWCMQHPSIIYFHNLKFDGEFIMCWLFEHGFKHTTARSLNHNEFSTLISSAGNFYSLKIRFNNSKIEFLDSLKIIPFAVKEIAKAFDLPMSKLEIDYKANRSIGHLLTNDEIDYIKNDVTIVALALKILFDQNLTKITQGSNALYDYKHTVGVKRFDHWFPPPVYDADIRLSYKGGWTYLNPRFQK